VTCNHQWHDATTAAGPEWVCAHCKVKYSDTKKAPSTKREWVGLTDEAIWSEYQTLWPFHPAEEPRLAKDIVKFAQAIEAKLKEKNENTWN